MKKRLSPFLFTITVVAISTGIVAVVISTNPPTDVDKIMITNRDPHQDNNRTLNTVNTTDSSEPIAINANLTTPSNTNSTYNIVESDNFYRNKNFGYQLTYPKNWFLREFETDYDESSEADGIQTACITNYPADLELHPQSGEIIICVDIYYTENAALANWYRDYRTKPIYDSYNNNEISTEETTINGANAIVEKIITGTRPASNRDTGWLDGVIVNTFIEGHGRIIQLSATVPSDSEHLLSEAHRIAQSIRLAQ